MSAWKFAELHLDCENGLHIGIFEYHLFYRAIHPLMCVFSFCHSFHFLPGANVRLSCDGSFKPPVPRSLGILLTGAAESKVSDPYLLMHCDF